MFVPLLGHLICCLDYMILFGHPLKYTLSLSKPLERLRPCFLQQFLDYNSFVQVTLAE